MQELASISIRAKTGGMELSTNFGFIIWWQMLLFIQLMMTMSKWASVLKFAFSKFFPISAHFCFIFHLVVLNKIFSFCFSVKMSFRTLDGSFLEYFLIILFLDVAFFFVNLFLFWFNVTILLTDMFVRICRVFWIVAIWLFSIRSFLATHILGVFLQSWCYLVW